MICSYVWAVVVQPLQSPFKGKHKHRTETKSKMYADVATKEPTFPQVESGSQPKSEPARAVPLANADKVRITADKVCQHFC